MVTAGIVANWIFRSGGAGRAGSWGVGSKINPYRTIVTYNFIIIRDKSNVWCGRLSRIRDTVLRELAAS